MPGNQYGEIGRLRDQLQDDAQKLRADPLFEQRPDWVDIRFWPKYTGYTGKRLYHSFSDDELLDIIRRETVLLGRIPAQREIFCVYRDYIRRRFGNWVKALRAAGLRESKSRDTGCQNRSH